MKSIHSILLLSSVVFSLGCSRAADGKASEGIPASYPLKKCVISDESFGGEMGRPVKVTHEGTDVFLCCKSCLKDFNADPAKYAKMVKDAAAKK